MSIGASIFLIAVGLILALAVNIDISGVDLPLVGWILAALGIVGLVLSFALRGRRTVIREEPVREVREVRDDYPRAP